MLNRFVPEPRLVEVDYADIGAPPDRVYAAFRALDAAKNPLIRMLFEVRATPALLRGQPYEPPRLKIADLVVGKQPGFRVLDDDPGRAFVVGAIAKVWIPEIEFHEVKVEAFEAFAEPGWAKVAWEVRFEPRGVGTRVVFELRVAATDDDAWAKTRRYLRFVGPFSHWIRREILSTLANELGTLEASETKRALPGDALLADAQATATYGITIEATPQAIWPFLLQMGAQRAGWYSFDWLDHDGHPSEWEVKPELAKLTVGQIVAAKTKGKDGYEVLAVDEHRSLVLGGLWDVEGERQLPFAGPLPDAYWRVTWAFSLERLGPHETRLIARARADFAPVGLRWKAAWIAPVHHLMQTRQLENLKARAEHHTHGSWRDVGDGVVGALAMVLDFATPFLRGVRSHWGVAPEIAERPHPGDQLVPAPIWQWTHGVEIDAPVTEVWPWIAQIGQGKAGFYSYQFLENLVGCEVQNADHVHPEWSQPKVGDHMRLHPAMPPLAVMGVEENRYLLVHQPFGTDVAPSGDPTAGVSWLFELEPLASGGTRLISRYRIRYDETIKNRLVYGPALLESVGFVMDRRMLLGVKERVDRARNGPTRALSGHAD